MKNYKILTGGIFFACGMMLTSCFDSNYDLLNIDTNARVEVNNLTIPVKVEGLKLEKLLDIDNDGQIRKVKDANGNEIYALIETGEVVSAENLKIDLFQAKPNLNTKEGNQTLMDLTTVEGTKTLDEARDAAKAAYMMIPGKTEAEAEADARAHVWDEVPTNEAIAKYKLETSSTTSLKAEFNGVHKSIRRIDYIASKPCDFVVTFELDNDVTAALKKKMPLKDIKIQLPKGMEVTTTVGKYNSSTGVLDLTAETVYIENGKLYTEDKGGKKYEGLQMKITGLDAHQDYFKFIAKENAEGSIEVNADVKVIEGSIEIWKSSFADGKTYFDLAKTATYMCIPTIGDITITQFSGDICYEFDNINIAPVEIKDIPSSLDGEDNDITLANPQIYISINNPLHGDFSAATSFTMTPSKNGVKRPTVTLDNNAEIVVSKDKKDNSFCLSPTKPDSFYKDAASNVDYTNADWLGFSGLKSVLGGKGGIPDMVEITASPRAEATNLVKYDLGKKIDDIRGTYTFFAPLALDENSYIEYKDSIDDISGDDDTMEKLVIKSLKIKALVSTNVPVQTSVFIQALKDANDNVIKDIETSSIVLQPNTPKQEIELKVVAKDQNKGIRDLDKIVFKATIVGNKDEKPLSPVQFIDFEQLKITVDGYYEDEF